MTANRIEFDDYVEQLRRAVPYLHPVRRVTINIWIDDMIDAADHGDARTVAKLAQRVQEKIEQEQKWQRENLAFTNAPRTSNEEGTK
jgi:hypothetical protein